MKLIKYIILAIMLLVPQVAGAVDGDPSIEPVAAATVTNATLTTALTVDTGTVTLTGHSNNDSVLTIGTGAVSVSGSNTGDSSNDNILINQDFAIWQENTTFTNPTNSVYTADGYYIVSADGDGTLPSINVKKNTSNMEVGFKQCCELEITNVGVSGAGRVWDARQTVEDYENYRNKSITLSVRIKASVAMTLSDGLLQLNDGITTGSIAMTSITTSWVTYSCTIADVSDASNRLTTRLQLIPFGTGTISTTGSIYIQWMKLEIGSIATPLVPRSTGDELRRCQRYYQKSYLQTVFPGAVSAVGSRHIEMTALASANHNVSLDTQFPVTMKAAPTVVVYDMAGTSGKVRMAAGDGITGTVANESDSGFKVTGTNGAASTTRKLAYHYTAISRI